MASAAILALSTAPAAISVDPTALSAILFDVTAEFATSSSIIVPLTMLAEATVISVGSGPDPSLSRVKESLAILLPDISALAFISALTILPSTIWLDVTKFVFG